MKRTTYIMNEDIFKKFLARFYTEKEQIYRIGYRDGYIKALDDLASNSNDEQHLSKNSILWHEATVGTLADWVKGDCSEAESPPDLFFKVAKPSKSNPGL